MYNNIKLPILGKIKVEESSQWGEYKYSCRLNKYQFENIPIDISVNFKNINQQTIQEVSKPLNQLKSLIQYGKNGIVDDYNKKGEAEYYIREWKDYIFEQIFSEEEYAEFISDTDPNLKIENRLLHKIRPVQFSIYAESEHDLVTIDYAFGYDIDKGFRDDMLVVKLNKTLKIENISTEG